MDATGGSGEQEAPSWRVAIVDDHALVADALTAWASEHLPDVRVVYAGADPGQVPPGTDLVLLDIDLGAGAPDPADTTRRLVAEGCVVLLVSAVGDAARIRPALSAGAIGYVPKRGGSEVLAEAIRAGLAGELYISPDLAAVLVASADRPVLSGQEEMALRLYASGLKLEAVARRMGISPHTVREYLGRVRRKYAEVGRDVRTKTDLYAAALKDGLIDREE
jgi:DNA-binding NarL/FixJ family response regulator